MHQIEQQLHSIGLMPKGIIIGKPQRCGTTKYKTKPDGFYHVYQLGEYITLYAKNWITNEEVSWHNWSNKKLSKADQGLIKSMELQMQTEIEDNVKERRRLASKEYEVIESITPLTHAYLTNKHITTNINNIKGVKVTNVVLTSLPKLLGSKLIYPIGTLDESFNFSITGYQAILEDGSKRFSSSTASQYFVIGNISLSPEQIFIGEGFATVVSIYEALNAINKNNLYIVALDCNNLSKVTDAIIKLYPKASVTLIADNDIDTPKKGENKGLDTCREIKSKHQHISIFVPMKEVDGISVKCDANDIGIEELRSQLNHIENQIPDIEQIALKKDKILKNFTNTDYELSFNHPEWGDTYIGDKIEILAMIDLENTKFKRLYFNNITIDLPCGIFADTKKSIGELGNAGYAYDATKSRYLLQYLSLLSSDVNLLATKTTGWYNEKTYILPNFCTNNEVLYMGGVDKEKYTKKGNLEEWKSNIANLCIGNIHLESSLMIAFASILTYFTGIGWGLHFYGKSKGGKSTLLKVAGSVFGHHLTQLNSWQGTPVFMEKASYQSNNALLILDEITKAKLSALDCIYEIINGVARGRGNIQKTNSIGEVGISKRQSWLTTLLSSGEVSVASMFKKHDQQLRAGENTRFLDIKVPPKIASISLNTKLNENLDHYYGAPVECFTQYICDNKIDVKALYDLQFKELSETYPISDTDPQASHVLGYFTLMVVACNIAKQANILPEEFYSDNCLELLEQWIKNNSGNFEEELSVELLNTILDKHTYYFMDENDRGSKDAVGYHIRTQHTDTYYLIDSAFREFLIKNGASPESSIKDLQDKGLISSKTQKRIGGQRPRVYEILTKKED